MLIQKIKCRGFSLLEMTFVLVIMAALAIYGVRYQNAAALEKAVDVRISHLTMVRDALFAEYVTDNSGSLKTWSPSGNNFQLTSLPTGHDDLYGDQITGTVVSNGYQLSVDIVNNLDTDDAKYVAAAVSSAFNSSTTSNQVQFVIPPPAETNIAKNLLPTDGSRKAKDVHTESVTLDGAGGKFKLDKQSLDALISQKMASLNTGGTTTTVTVPTTPSYASCSGTPHNGTKTIRRCDYVASYSYTTRSWVPEGRGDGDWETKTYYSTAIFEQDHNYKCLNGDLIKLSPGGTTRLTQHSSSVLAGGTVYNNSRRRTLTEYKGWLYDSNLRFLCKYNGVDV